MSVNTIKLATAEGDKYINQGQTIIYKDISLFGYGYLDWGTVVNQALVRLIDQVDSLQDSNLSEIQFDLVEYEETQKNLRAQEFDIWKNGFKTTLNNLIQTYITDTSNMITEFTEAQGVINTGFSETINSHYSELSENINDIINTLDEKIIEVINAQLSVVTESLNNLSNKVEQTNLTLEQATLNLNQATQEVRQLISNFKTEFSTTFESFKTDTNKSLEDNKEYLIKYIDEKLSGVGSVTGDLENRLNNLEMISDSLNPAYVNTLISEKVTQIASGVIATYLENYDMRLTNLTNSVEGLVNNIDELLNNKINPIQTGLNEIISTQNTSLLAITRDVQEISNTIEPINQFRIDIEQEFTTTERFLETIGDNVYVGLLSKAFSLGASKDYKNLIKNIYVADLNMAKDNIKKLLGLIRENNLNLLAGLKYTEFNELDLIRSTSYKEDLINTYFNSVQTNLLNYSGTTFKFTGLYSDLDKKRLDFSFTLPNIKNFTLWSTKLISIKNLRTNEVIESNFMFSDGLLSNHTLEYFNKLEIVGNVELNKLNPFEYYINFNSSGIVNVTFDDLIDTDNIQIVVKDEWTNEIFSDVVVPVIEFNKNGYLSDAWLTNTYPTLYKDDLTITKPTLDYTDVAYTTDNSRILIPIHKITTTTSGSKELGIKICLPNGAELTKIEFDDGITITTKNFTNQTKFPENITDYNTRNLSSTNNYYKDLGTTGLLWFPINQESLIVKTIVTYKIGSTTKTEAITTAGTGGGAESKLVNINLSPAVYYDINISTLFGAGTDANLISVEPRVLENTAGSELYGKYIKGDNLCSVVWLSSSIIRVYNEYTSTLSFQILLKK